jgi:hypothetical protein
LIIIIASTILIIANFILSENFERGFWMTTLSGILVIIGMVLTIKETRQELTINTLIIHPKSLTELNSELEKLNVEWN